jgi:arylsulfatase A-like enzyme
MKYLMVVILLLSVHSTSFGAEQAQPNFVLIVTDDQSWAGTSICMDDRVLDRFQDRYETPAVVRLAKEGMRFSAGYAAAPVCSPSRYSIQWGQSVARHGVTDVQKLFREAPVFEDRDTLVEVLKRVDDTYVAAHFGKWHILGDPAEMGFDLSDGKTGNKEGGFALKDEYETRLQEDPKLTDSLKQKSVDFLKQMAKEGSSFFLQISHYANHTWVVADPDDFDKQPLKDAEPMTALYRAMTVALDRSVEGVLNCLDELGLAENTYVIFTSDNGAVPSLPPSKKPRIMNAPLTGGKWSLREGGIRVPFVVRGPGIAAGEQCDVPVSGIDILPTFFELAGGKQLQTVQVVDGMSFAPLLFDADEAKTTKRLMERPLTWHYPKFNTWELQTASSAFRLGNWKLIHNWETNQSQLFNIKTDVSEGSNLSEKLPALTSAMRVALFAELRAAGQSIPAVKR